MYREVRAAILIRGQELARAVRNLALTRFPKQVHKQLQLTSHQDLSQTVQRAL